ncbi:hypothetical protein Dimus_038614 [Dionaea muscipula]
MRNPFPVVLWRTTLGNPIHVRYHHSSGWMLRHSLSPAYASNHKHSGLSCHSCSIHRCEIDFSCCHRSVVVVLHLVVELSLTEKSFSSVFLARYFIFFWSFLHSPLSVDHCSSTVAPLSC